MSIVRARLQEYSLELKDPWPSADGDVHVRRGWIVGLDDDSGRTGLGDAAPFPGFGMETHASCGAALKGALRRIAGIPRDSFPLAITNLSVLRVVAAAPAARHAIDGALHDLISQSAGVPLSRYFGGDQALDQVPVNAVIPRVSAERTATLAAQAASDGFTTIKLKVGGVPKTEDRARIEAARASVGSDVRIRIDANQAWGVEEAVDALRSFAPLDLEYVEQPVAAEDIEGLKQVRSRSGVRIAADEAVRDLPTAEQLLYGEAADLLILKPMALGGLKAARAVLDFAAERGTPVVVTSLLESAIGRSAATHLAASLGRMPHAHGLATGGALQRDLVPSSAPKQGCVHVPQAPGIGITLPDSFWNGALEVLPE